ncbi:MAG TPA: rhodanese-like domain-containing protein [Phycisphaerales bacterium]|nr:rhodanese-like domain-containing protein [Phycisphaerales bacterium]
MLLHRACVIALAGILAGAFHSAVGPKLVLRPEDQFPAPQPRMTNGAAEASSAAAAPATLGLDISLADAAALFEQGAAFIDARRREEYEAGHVENAFWLPADQLTGGRPAALDYLDAEAPLVIYCGGGDCDASHNTAALLQQLGYKRTHVMKDGFPAWRDAGKPVATGAPVYESGGR